MAHLSSGDDVHRRLAASVQAIGKLQQGELII